MLGRLLTLRHPLLRQGLRGARPSRYAPLRGFTVSANIQSESAATLVRGTAFVKKLAVELEVSHPPCLSSVLRQTVVLHSFALSTKQAVHAWMCEHNSSMTLSSTASC